MRQLDLFGMPIGDEPEDETSEAKKGAAKKKEKATPKAKEADPQEGLFVETAGAKNDFTGEDQAELIAEQSISNNITSEPPAIEEIVEKASAIKEEKGEDLAVEAPHIEIDNTTSASNITETGSFEPAIEYRPKKVTEELRASSVVFDDGRISVKIKAKAPVVVEPVAKEKVPKEPQKRGRKSFHEIDAEVDLIEIPEDEELFSKQYYSISEVAKWFRVNTSLIRYWENEFDILKPKKNRKGDRLFRPEDVKNLQLIYQLLRQRKYTIEGAKEYMKTNKKKADLQLQLTQTLNRFKRFLLDLKANLQ